MPEASIASPVPMTPPTKPTAVPPPAPGAKLKTSAFKVPGEGSSFTISVVTVLTLIALWFLVTNMGWVKPLFLPTPQAVFQTALPQ